MKRRTIVLLALAAVVSGFVGCLVYLDGTSATAELQRRFGIDATQADEIRAALLTMVPVGTPEDAVVAFLEAHGIGTSEQSRMQRRVDEMDCGIYWDERRPYWMSGESYRLYFAFDDSRRLRDIRVQKSLLRL